jgi:V/A-type H+/Na+-transporting ATPase subunit D
MRLRIPPGRAGRLWLRERLASARKAADLLDHKRRELEAELQRLRTIATRREKAWQAAAREAQQWLGRVDAAGAERSLRLAVSLEGGPADVQLKWQQVMGVRYPTDHATRFPEQPQVSSLDGGVALAPATTAYRRALDAAVAHAVVRTALERILADVHRTIRRLRALQLRAIPAHENALAALELMLDEKDRQDTVAARWAAENAMPVGSEAPEASKTPEASKVT